jgi:hypothetical protein
MMMTREIFIDIEPSYYWHAMVVSLLMDQLELAPFRGGMWGEVPLRNPLPVTSLRYAHVCADSWRN